MWSFFCVFLDLSLSLSSPHNTQTHVTGVCGGATTAATASPAALSDTSAAAASAVAERRRSAQAEAATGVEGEGAGGRRGEGEEAAVGKRAGKRGRWWGRGGSPRARPRSTTTTREGAGPVSLSRSSLCHRLLPPAAQHIELARIDAPGGLVSEGTAGEGSPAPRRKWGRTQRARALGALSRSAPLLFLAFTHAHKHSPINGIVNRRPRAGVARQGACSERMVVVNEAKRQTARRKDDGRGQAVSVTHACVSCGRGPRGVRQEEGPAG